MENAERALIITFDTRVLRKPQEFLEIEHYMVILGGPNPLHSTITFWRRSGTITVQPKTANFNVGNSMN